jgi:hypothetical protein
MAVRQSRAADRGALLDRGDAQERIEADLVADPKSTPMPQVSVKFHCFASSHGVRRRRMKNH